MSTKIEWTDETWNPVTGCNPVSEGCKNCYAERMSKRLAGRFGYLEAPDHFKVTLHPERLHEPLKWKKPRRIFVCSMSDLFHKDVPDEFIFDVLTIVAKCPQHTFQVLTKRLERMAHLWRHADVNAYPNLWLGVSAENQATADERIPLLLQIPAAVRFVSCEPLLGLIKLPSESSYIDPDGFGYNGPMTTEMGNWGVDPDAVIDWVIVGGETGPGARPMHPDWLRSIRDQCQEAGVPFFFKGWGEWRPTDPHEIDQCGVYIGEEQSTSVPGRQECGYYCDEIVGHVDHKEHIMVRVGKQAAGRLLDGREWNEILGGER